MNTLVLVFHPHLHDGSRINRTLAETAAAAPSVTVRDEYALYPDFRIDAEAEQETLLAADRVVWQFPMYWYSSPPCSSSGRTRCSGTAGPMAPAATSCTARS